jgi:PAS domain S-box-containing protein
MHTQEHQSQLLSLALKSSNSGIWDWDMTGDTVFFDPSYYRMAGYQPNEFPHKFSEWEKRVHPDDLAPAKKAFQRYMAGNTEAYSAEFRFKTKAGEWMWILTKGEATERDEKGNPTRFTGLHIDISQIKGAEKAFEEERAFSTSLINTAQMIVLILDVEGRIQRINPYMEKLTGYKEVEVKGKDWFDTFLPPANYTEIHTVFQNAVIDIASNAVVNPILTKDGQVITIEWYNKSLKDIDGRVIGMLSLGVDITERIKAEKELKTSEEKFRLAFKTSPDSINLNRLEDGVYLEINDGFSKITGYSADEVLGISSLDLKIWKKKEDREKLLQELQEKGYVENLEAQFVAKNGDIIIGLISARIIEIDGEPVVLTIIRDITARKLAEEKFKTIINEASIGIGLADAATGELLECNPALAQMLDYTREELIGQPQSIIDQGPMADSALSQNFIQHRDVDFGNTRCQTAVTKQGKVIDVEVKATIFKLGNKTFMLGFFQDITQRKQAEKEHLELETQLRQKYKMEAVGVMAGGMAHNFNNNLSIILGNLELSKMKLPANPEVDSYLDNAKIAVFRSRDLVKQIMAYSRPNDQGKQALKVSLLVDETLELLRSTIPTTINLLHQINADNQDLTIHADSSQLQECLINLCNNAMQAMEETGTLTISLQPEELQKQDIPMQYNAQPGKFAKISVADTGCGMAPETIEKIFDLFYTTKAVDQGTGVGLSTVQGIVKDHGGLIKVLSTPELGTTFELYFPILESIAQADNNLINDIFPRGTERILFVDDDEMLAELGGKLLTGIGYQVSIITDSTEALKLFTTNAEHFDLVITDQTMPKLTGKDLIVELKKIRPDIPTIICTGYSSKIDEEEAQELGIEAFMLKPLDLTQLAQTVRKVLDEMVTK